MKYESIINTVLTDPRTPYFQYENANLYNPKYLKDLFVKANKSSMVNHIDLLNINDKEECNSAFTTLDTESPLPMVDFEQPNLNNNIL